MGIGHKYLLGAYIGFAIATFGAAWHHNPYTEKDSYAPTQASVVASAGCAAFWPLYWSYRLFEPK